MFCYLVDWGNDYVGGFSKSFEQLWNGTKSMLLFDLQFNKVDRIKIITHAELDELRGYHKPTMFEYLNKSEV